MRCLPEEVPPYVLLPGDPARAKMICDRWLKHGKLVMMNREFHTYRGTYKDLDVGVVSTGLGSPGAAMVVQDLGYLGAKAVIRVGTAGSGQSHVLPGDVVIATGAVRDEGLTRHLVTQGFPAVSDACLSDALFSAAKGAEVKGVHRGIIHTSDAFQSKLVSSELDAYRAAGVLAYEMEAAAVLVKSATLGIPAACIVAIDGFVGNVQEGDFAPDFRARDRGIKAMIRIALDALAIHASHTGHSTPDANRADSSPGANVR
jgi:uridine phosphorylase